MQIRNKRDYISREVLFLPLHLGTFIVADQRRPSDELGGPTAVTPLTVLSLSAIMLIANLSQHMSCKNTFCSRCKDKELSAILHQFFSISNDTMGFVEHNGIYILFASQESVCMFDKVFGSF